MSVSSMCVCGIYYISVILTAYWTKQLVPSYFPSHKRLNVTLFYNWGICVPSCMLQVDANTVILQQMHKTVLWHYFTNNTNGDVVYTLN